MKTRNAKHALIMSFISLLLCFSMLLGTTFAWFTDSVSNGINKIQSGNLDVELYHMNYAEAVAAGSVNGMAIPKNVDGIKVDANTKLFLNEDGKEMLWEPGATSVENFRIVNEGSLALKYQFKLEVVSATETPEGKTLADIINISASETEYGANDIPNGVDGAATLADRKLGDGYMFEAYLLPGEEYNFWVGLQWVSSDVDNEFNVEGGLSIDLGVTLLATQYTYEKDNFYNNEGQYDAGATYPVLPDIWDGTADTSWYNDTDTEFTLSTAEQLAGLADLVDAGDTFAGKTIKLSSDLDLYAEDKNGEPTSFEPIGSFSDNKAFKGTFDGQGHTVSNLYQNGWALQNGYWDGPEYGMGFFSLVENAAIKNINFDGASLPSEANIMGVVAGGAANCVFENINITNAYLGNHSWYSGGAIGWAEGDIKLINCDIDANSVVSSQWGDFNNANGGLIGGIDSSSAIYLKDCDVACVIDAYNDVTSAYEWYSYRSCGMLIGDTGQMDDPDGNNVGNAIAPNLTCENVTVTYGDWANYHYCEFGSSSYPFCRVEAGESTGAYGNARVGEYSDANGNKVVDDNHVHNDGEKHNELIVFDQLYGGESGDRYCTYGTATHDGVTVTYNNK